MTSRSDDFGLRHLPATKLTNASVDPPNNRPTPPPATHLHVVHHQLIGELHALLRVHDLAVHERVDQGDAAVDGEGSGRLLVKVGEVRPGQLVTELGHA